MKILKIAVLLGLPLALSCMTGPLNGATHGGPIVGAQFNVGGYYVSPGVQIDVQVLSSPAANPNINANWTNLATIFSSNSPTDVNGEPLYYWSATVTPVPQIWLLGRWPPGGLVKLRALAREGGSTYNTYTFDQVSFTDCWTNEYLAGSSGQNIGIKCQGLGRNVVTMVSTSNNPANASPPVRQFLGLKYDHAAGEAEQYYDAWYAPESLAEFKTKYVWPGSGEVTATFYNDSDLGVGREMHCWEYARGLLNTTVGTACYVSNYSDTAGTPKFGTNNVNTALNNAIAHAGEFATVAMVTEKYILSGTPGPVNFVAFGGNGLRVSEAQLDNANLHRSIPNNCLTCHGVDTYYDNNSDSILGRANFLPFDPSGYKFSGSPSYTRTAQEEEFRQLNQMVRETEPAAAITGLIDGSYLPSTVNTPGATWNDLWVPDAWRVGSPQEDYPTLYKGVVRPYCRTCHVSAGPGRDFAEASDFDTLKPVIMARACGSDAAANGYFMPHAEHPFRLFWASGARAYLNSWGGDADGNGCKP